MIDFPAATAVHRRMPKEAFYKHLPLTTALKEKFVSDVDRIFVENSLTKDNLNLTAAWKEQQPKKRFALYSELQTYQKELEELKSNPNP